MGRSNVGKSSLINRLLGVKGLARTSSSPGRTQTVNFYYVNDRFFFVDLPGYGWARVPEAIRRSWKPMIEGVLERRRDRIVLGVLVIDARHPPSELDQAMLDWIEAEALTYVVVATKTDKLSGNEKRKSREALESAYLKRGVHGAALFVSAETGDGMRELWRYIDAALTEKGCSRAVRRGS